MTSQLRTFSSNGNETALSTLSDVNARSDGIPCCLLFRRRLFMVTHTSRLTALPRRSFIVAAAAVVGTGLGGCAVSPPTIERIGEVDLRRFMGDWFVIGNIPTLPERDAYDAVESYTLDDDGRIRTRFRYREGAFDGPLRTMNPVGEVVPGTGNAVWGMQFVWPIKAEYVIVDVDRDYSLTIIGRSARDYAWIMARQPSIPEQRYDAAAARLRALGYDISKLRRVPQRWPQR